MKRTSLSKAAIIQQLSQRFLLFATLTVLVVLTAGFFVVIKPKIADIQTSGIARLEQTRAQRDSVAESLRLTRSIVESYRIVNARDIEKVRSALPTSADLPAMFIQVEAVALSAGLRLSNVSFTLAAPARRGASAETAKETSSGFQQLQVTFTVAGGRGYVSLKNFLSTIESSVRLLDVQSLSHNPVKAGEEETYTMNAISYYQ